MSDTTPKFAVKSVVVSERPVTLRLPFKFGNTAVTRTAQVFAEVLLESASGRRVTGYSAQLMVPRWFNKAVYLSNDDTVDELRGSVRTAAREVSAARPGTIADLASDCRARSVLETTVAGSPRLAAGFGPALIEMALIDAACRHSDLPVDRAFNIDLFGLAAHCPDDLAPDILAQRLKSARVPDSMFLRHTVGQDAPLLESDLGPGAPADGLPVALETVIARQGVRYFKIKLNGDVEADVDRLVRLAGFLEERSPGFRATLDANEQYSVDGFAAFTERLQGKPELKGMAAAMLFVEQPFARDTALSDPLIPDLLKSLNVPVIIDESDDGDDVLPKALGLGYAGTSVKSCKGVFRALLNAARIDQVRAKGGTGFLSAEDLTCQPGLCVQQDLAMAGLCGATHAERNGHYFVAGMQGAAPAEVAAYLERHRDLYTPLGADDATLRVIDGAVSLSSLRTPGFSTSVLADLANNNKLSVQERLQ